MGRGWIRALRRCRGRLSGLSGPVGAMSVPGQNPLDLLKVEGEEVGNLLGGEGALCEGEDRLDPILLNSQLDPLLDSQLDSFLDALLNPDFFEPFRGGELPGELGSGIARDNGVCHMDPFALSVLGQNPLDLLKIEGEEVGNLLGGEGAL